MMFRRLLALVATLVLLVGVMPPATAAPAVSAANAGAKPVGQRTFAWGSVSEPGVRDVWTEVDVGGRWSRSQTRRTTASGSYTIELTYGITSVGGHRFRVGAATSAGTVYSEPFVLQRTNWGVGSAGTKVAGHHTNTWGTLDTAAGRQVWTEAFVNGRWSRSQTRTANGSGYFVIPLTYGINQVGSSTFRVGASTAFGTVHSAPFTIDRTPWVVGSAGTKALGEATNTWATLPSAANRQVWTEVLVNGRWSRSQTRTANASGYFVIPLTYGINQVGTQTFRVGASTTSGTLHSARFTLSRSGPTSLQSQLLALTNQYRAVGAQCGPDWRPPTHPLTWNDTLASAAQRHSDDMARLDFMAHEGSDGSSPAQRVTEAGYEWQAVGENVAVGYRTAQAVTTAWIESPGHCNNIMSPNYTEFGATLSTNYSGVYGTYWAQSFAAPWN